MITLTDMGVMYIRTCDTFRISRLRNPLNGRSAARMHKGEAPRDEYGCEGEGGDLPHRQRTPRPAAHRRSGRDDRAYGRSTASLPSRAEILPSARSNARTQSL